MSEQIIIFDTSLRDGEQSPGATMTLDEKLAIARKLDDMGVDVIEAGFAAASAGEVQCIDKVGRAVRNASVCSLARADLKDIEAAGRALENAAKPRIHTFISTSDIHIEHQFRMTREQVLERIAETVSYAKSLCEDVEWSAMDATRSAFEFLEQAVGVAVESGARTINIPDTVGYTVPQEYEDLMAKLSAAYPRAVFSVHCHNDLGLATANALAGIRGGARQIECTVNGIGERAGNTALEEVVMAIKTRPDFYGFSTGIDTQQIYEASRLVSSATGFPVQKNKAIVGANAFAHESGIHQDGMLKNRNTYEIITPESVGVDKTELVLGKHSGRAALKSKLSQWNIEMDDADFQAFFERFKNLCDSQKHVTEEDVLQQLIDEKSRNRFARLTAINFKQCGKDDFKANVTLALKGENKTVDGKGETPLAAVFDAINKLIETGVPNVLEFESTSIFHHTEPQAESKVTLICDNAIYHGHAYDRDTTMAAARAYLSAVNKILVQQASIKTGKDVA